MSDTMRNEPGQNEPEVASAILGCLAWLVLIIGGIWYWNHFQAESKRKAEEEVQRKVERMQQVIQQQQKSAAEQSMKEWTKELGKLDEMMQKVQEMKRRP